MVFMVKGNTQGGIMIEGDHHPSLPQKSTNAMVDIGLSDGKEKVGSDLLWSRLIVPGRLSKKNGTVISIRWLQG